MKTTIETHDKYVFVLLESLIKPEDELTNIVTYSKNYGTVITKPRFNFTVDINLDDTIVFISNDLNVNFELNSDMYLFVHKDNIVGVVKNDE